MENAAANENSIPGSGKRIERTGYQKFQIWFFQNRYNIFGIFSAVSLGLIIGFVEIKKVDWGFEDEIYEEVAFVSNLQVQQTEAAAPVEVPEGKITPTDKLEKAKEDERVANAVNPVQINATIPVDLSPDIKPEYTTQARQAGFEGTMYVDIVIADSGEVLQVRPVYRTPLDKSTFRDLGLERSAVLAFRKKRFAPAKKDGEPITVRIRVPVRYTLQ